MGDESGYIRFEEAEAAQKARAAAVLAKEEGLVVKNFIATLEPVTGEHQNWLLFGRVLIGSVILRWMLSILMLRRFQNRCL